MSATTVNTPATWQPNSRVTLCRVAWDAQYKDVVAFETEAERAAYFDSLASDSITIDKMSYLKPNEPIKINIPYSAAYTYNYLVVNNPELPVPNETAPPALYYFITGIAMVNPSTTALQLQLDVFQTYLYNFQLTRAYVERGHVAVQASNNTTGWANKMRYLQVAEGLDIGDEYLITRTEHFDLTSNDAGGGAVNNGLWVIVLSTTDLAADWGTETSPSLKTADGQFTDGLVSGCNAYAMAPEQFVQLVNALKDAPWVSKGIVSCTLFPKRVLTDGAAVSLGGVQAYFLGTTPDEGVYWTDMTPVANQLLFGIPDKYRSLYKLFTYPYSAIEITNYTGSNLIIKPQLLTDENLSLCNIACAAVPHARLGFYVQNYGYNKLLSPFPSSTYRYFVMDNTQQYKTGTAYNNYYIDNAIWFTNLPTFNLTNDEYTMYLASTTNSRAWQYNSAGWSLAKSNASTQLSFDQTQQQLATNQTNMDVQNVQRLISGVSGAVGNIAGRNPLGLVSGAVGSATDYWAANEQFANNQNLTNAFANQNKELANWAQQGDYENAIASINATVQDAALTQPSTSGQAGGDGFNVANGLFGVFIRYKTISYNMMAVCGEYFHRYGYAVHEFIQMPESLHCMNKYTYWKCKEVYMNTTAGDEGVKETIRGIFEKGVTVWHTPGDIGTVAPDNNTALPGVAY